MNRIGTTFKILKSAGKKALIPYITPEYPFSGITLPMLRTLEKAGADLIEVGIPFSDPLADGKTIQLASEQALKNGARLGAILAAIREFRKTSQLPILLMGYYNPILRKGNEEFCQDVTSSGVDGLIVPDLPPEEADEFRRACGRVGLSNVFLLAPTTPDTRISFIDGLSSDFSYCVSVTGVTGARSSMGEGKDLDEFLQRVRQHTKKPFVVGFGISHADHVKHVWRSADGAVVGSALLNAVRTATTPESALQVAGDFLRSLRPTY